MGFIPDSSLLIPNFLLVFGIKRKFPLKYIDITQICVIVIPCQILTI